MNHLALIIIWQFFRDPPHHAFSARFLDGYFPLHFWLSTFLSADCCCVFTGHAHGGLASAEIIQAIGGQDYLHALPTNTRPRHRAGGYM